MNKRAITKRMVQAVGVAFGLLGLLGVVSVALIAIAAIMDSDRSILFETPLPFVCGGICIAIAWQSLCRFGQNAVRNTTALVVLTLYGILVRPGGLVEPATGRIKSPLVDGALFWIPLLLAFLLCRAVSKRLIQITEGRSIPEHQPVSSEAVPSGPPDEPSA